MKKTPLINGPMSRVVALLGHTDGICIADAGLPIPAEVERIDLAVRKGLPSFLDVLDSLTSEMCVEAVQLAEELRSQQPDYHAKIVSALKALEAGQGNSISIDYVPHEQFKAHTKTCKAVIRTGECTPYANIILTSGVTF